MLFYYNDSLIPTAYSVYIKNKKSPHPVSQITSNSYFKQTQQHKIAFIRSRSRHTTPSSHRKALKLYNKAQSVSAAAAASGHQPVIKIIILFQVRYTGYRDRPQEERQVRFQNACREGHTEIAFAATGTNLQLVFTPPTTGYMPDKECDFEKEPGKVGEFFPVRL